MLKRKAMGRILKAKGLVEDIATPRVEKNGEASVEHFVAGNGMTSSDEEDAELVSYLVFDLTFAWTRFVETQRAQPGMAVLRGGVK